MKRGRLKRVSRKEWNSLPKGYKGYVDGKPYVLAHDTKLGTVYVPVRIVKK